MYCVNYCIGLYLTFLNSRTWIFYFVHIVISQRICKTLLTTFILRETITLKEILVTLLGLYYTQWLRMPVRQKFVTFMLYSVLFKCTL